MGVRNLSRLCFLICLVTIAGRSFAQIGVALPEGFRIEKWIEEPPSNIYSLCTAADGSVVVAGPGYFKVYSDVGSPGQPSEVASISHAFADGAQGMCFDGRDLLAVGNGGLWRFPDALTSDVSAKPQRIFEIKTGGEHDAHAIRKGPHGWWYLIAGNGVPIRPEFHSGANSPVKEPRAGFLMRISPDFKTKEIVAHGFRNAYDFDFGSRGEIFVYDSDGERDISLPWYRPTRVFQIRPGDDAGWVSVGWKRPSYFFDMPDEIGDLGRGSPTGVACYTGSQFPAEYQDAIFAADWTFGRILAFKRRPDGSYDRGSPFATATQQFGFAVTDLVVARDGSLIVSVGGRGTEGGVYRIQCESGQLEKSTPASRTFDLPLPWASPEEWSEHEIERLIDAINHDDTSTSALEHLVGRTQIPFRDNDQRSALQRAIVGSLRKFTPNNRLPLFRILRQKTLRLDLSNELPALQSAFAAVAMGDRADGEERMRQLEWCVDAIRDRPEHAGLLLRLAQIAVGDCAGAGDAAFHSYTAAVTLNDPSSVVKQLDELYSGLQPQDRYEAARLVAMLSAGRNFASNQWFADQISTSDPVDQIHGMMAAAKSGIRFDESTAAEIAEALIALPGRLRATESNTDRNWTPRMISTVGLLLQNGPLLDALRKHREFGRSDQEFLFRAIPGKAQPIVAERILEQIRNDSDNVSPAQLAVVATYGQRNEIKSIMRGFVSRPSLSGTALLALCQQPESVDYPHFITGIGSFDANVIKRSAIALRKCAPTFRDRMDVVRVFKSATKLGWDRRDSSVRDQLMLLIKQWTRRRFGYEFKRSGLDQSARLNRWRQHFIRNFHREYQLVIGTASESTFEEKFRSVDWRRGSSWRGGKLYEKLQCAQCHDAGNRLGPRLEGITQRFSKKDLFRSIMFPDEQVPQRYRMKLVETIDGILHSGTVIYESADGVTLMEPSGRTVRVNREDIEQSTRSMKSLMPSGLLDETNPQDWADLFEYLAGR